MSCFHRYHQRNLFSSVSVAFLRPTISLRRISHLILPASRFYATSTELISGAVRPSVWHSIIPRFLRKPRGSSPSPKVPRSKEWNPATFFIVIFLFIGSNSIQMITLKNDFANFSRKSDARINLLQEIIDRVQKGENVDVEGLLGTGDVEKEQEWGSVLREIEEEDRLWQTKEKRNQKKLSGSTKEALKSEDRGPPEAIEEKPELKSESIAAANEAGDKVSNKKSPGFY